MSTLIGLIGVNPPAAHAAAAGALDTGFDGDGMVTTDIFGGYSDGATDLAIQSDGKIVAVGWSEGYGGSSPSNFAVVRHKSDGSVDTPFGNGGRLLTDIGHDDDVANAVAIQPDGKIVVVGWAILGLRPADFAVVRYNTDGSLDSSFAGNGKTATDFGATDVAEDVVIQPDGKIVVVGYTDPHNANSDFAVARYNTNGTLDKTFSADGKLTTGLGGMDGAMAVALQRDGRIVVAGYKIDGDFDFQLAVARYRADGTLDSSFDGDGKMSGGRAGEETAHAVAIQQDGKIVVAGGGDTSHGWAFHLARFNPNGSFDSTFAGGAEAYDFGGDTSGALDVAIQTDGKIVAAGWRWSSSGKSFALARVKSNGSLDTSFSGDGKVITNFGGRDGAEAVAIQRDGKIVLGGDHWRENVGYDFALARYHAVTG